MKSPVEITFASIASRYHAINNVRIAIERDVIVSLKEQGYKECPTPDQFVSVAYTHISECLSILPHDRLVDLISAEMAALMAQKFAEAVAKKSGWLNTNNPENS